MSIKFQKIKILRGDILKNKDEILEKIGLEEMFIEEQKRIYSRHIGRARNVAKKITESNKRIENLKIELKLINFEKIEEQLREKNMTMDEFISNLQKGIPNNDIQKEVEFEELEIEDEDFNINNTISFLDNM